MNAPFTNSSQHHGREDVRDGPRRWDLRTVITVGSMLVVLTSCLNQLEFIPQEPVSCSTRRLNAASGLYDEAKGLLELHFRERQNHFLVFAYYISRDSESLSRTIRHCDDFREHKSRAVDLILANRVLRRVLRVNMRDSDPIVMTTILGDRYDAVFKNDIH